MERGDQMPKIDKTTGLKQSELNFMKLMEEQNLDRVRKLQKIRRNNVITGSVIGAGVLGIYFYSMYAVQQERFLDDFNEPEKIQRP